MEILPTLGGGEGEEVRIDVPVIADIVVFVVTPLDRRKVEGVLFHRGGCRLKHRRQIVAALLAGVLAFGRGCDGRLLGPQ